MQEGSHPERREVRYPFPYNILINGKILVKGIDISIGGLYVHTGRAFDRGRIVDISIPDYNFMIKARIQHSQPSVGMGLKFLAVNESLKKKLRLLIQSIDANSGGLQLKSKPEVLLIDDNASGRRINRSKLNLEGFKVIDVGSGTEAIKAMSDHTPNVIVCDIHMEGMDGLKLLSLIRSTPKWSRIPVIMISSTASVDIIDKVFEAGADEFLAKSTTSPAKLAEHVRGILESSNKQ